MVPCEAWFGRIYNFSPAPPSIKGSARSVKPASLVGERMFEGSFCGAGTYSEFERRPHDHYIAALQDAALVVRVRRVEFVRSGSSEVPIPNNRGAYWATTEPRKARYGGARCIRGRFDRRISPW